MSWKGRYGHRRQGCAVSCSYLSVLGTLPPEKAFCVGLGSFALVVNVKLHEGRAGSVLLAAVPPGPRPELRKYV